MSQDVLIRRAELFAWLRSKGLPDPEIHRILDKGLIKFYGLGPGWRLYNKTDIQRDVFPLYNIPPDKPQPTTPNNT